MNNLRRHISESVQKVQAVAQEFHPDLSMHTQSKLGLFLTILSIVLAFVAAFLVSYSKINDSDQLAQQPFTTSPFVATFLGCLQMNHKMDHFFSHRAQSAFQHKLCYEGEIGLFEFELEGTLHSLELHPEDNVPMKAGLVLSKDHSAMIELNPESLLSLAGMMEIPINESSLVGDFKRKVLLVVLSQTLRLKCIDVMFK